MPVSVFPPRPPVIPFLPFHPSFIPSVLPFRIIQCLSLSSCMPLVRPAGRVTGWLHPEEQLENTLKAS